MRRLLVAILAVVAVPMASAVGCNAILGNEPGVLGSDGASSACASDEKSCATCVKTDDPKVGCGGACNVCPSPPNGQSACALANGAEECSLGACNPQFDNCDQNTSNGCETHTTTHDHCGSCGIDCNNQPFCERQGDTYVCSNTCDAPNVQCPDGDGGVDCVDPQTDIDHCGNCGTSCAVSNGSGTCVGGACQLHCDPQYFACGNRCVPASAAQCGSSCAPCTAPNTCDTNPASVSYGTCIAPSDAGSSCSTHVCGSTCCGNNSDLCCPFSPTACTPTSAGACGASCDICSGTSSCSTGACGCSSGSDRTCSLGVSPATVWCCPLTQACSTTTTGKCDIVCSAPYTCQSGSMCGCTTSGGNCNTSPDFSSNQTCGSCSACMTGTCCCAGGGADAGYSCSGRVPDAGIGSGSDGGTGIDSGTTTGGCDCSGVSG